MLTVIEVSFALSNHGAQAMHRYGARLRRQQQLLHALLMTGAGWRGTPERMFDSEIVFLLMSCLTGSAAKCFSAFRRRRRADERRSPARASRTDSCQSYRRADIDTRHVALISDTLPVVSAEIFASQREIAFHCCKTRSSPLLSFPAPSILLGRHHISQIDFKSPAAARNHLDRFPLRQHR